MLRIAAVAPDSLASELGLLPGDELLSINARELVDFLDWEFLAADESFVLSVRTARGEAVAGFALTEPEAGSDVAALAMRAVPDGDGFRLQLTDPDGAEATLRCGMLVNAAGHGAPAVATALGYPLDGGEGVPAFRQRANKGRYYDFTRPELARAVSRPVYPIPPRSGTVLQHQASAGGLGLHLSVDIDGAAHLGPDTEWLPDDAPRDYRADDTRRAAFLEAGRRLLPDLAADDLVPGQVGYRPKLVGDGTAPPDFLIWPDRGYVHLGGIESPGLTSSLAIAGEVARIVG